jgi:general secretion pathway protein B
MSLILEALRKSEAERRRGQAPDLHAELPPAAQPVRSARPAWQWPTLAIGAAAALAWLALGPWSPPPTLEVSANGMDRSAANDAVVVSSAGDGGLDNRDAATATTVVHAPPARLDPPDRTGTPPSLRPRDIAMDSARATAAIPPPRPAGSAATPPRDATAMTDRVATPMTPPGSAPLPRPTPQPPPALATAVPSAPLPASDDADAAAPSHLSDLSAAERLELPALKMSMHMWGPTTGERFAIIDGVRVNEGDRVGDAVVEEITARAVVLAWRGQRLQIPLR